MGAGGAVVLFLSEDQSRLVEPVRKTYLCNMLWKNDEIYIA